VLDIEVLLLVRPFRSQGMGLGAAALKCLVLIHSMLRGKALWS
jgi:hypothetical protein